jgi:hypothetical protein
VLSPWPFNCTLNDLNGIADDAHELANAAKLLPRDRTKIERLCLTMMIEDVETYALVPRAPDDWILSALNETAAATPDQPTGPLIAVDQYDA